MEKMNFTVSSDDDLGQKLRKARIAQNLSTRDVASRLAGQISISHATIANYESGRTQPTLAVLRVLSQLYVTPLERFFESGPALTGICYRSQKSKLKAADKEVFEAQSIRWLEAYVRIENRLDEKLRPQLE